ncbi:MAG: WecB/TagA/CpsF family glycosyltransferase [Candidatus Shapirobacteria bacterium]
MIEGKWGKIEGVNLWWGNKEQVLKIIEKWISSGQKRKRVATVNPEFVMQAVEDKNFFETLEKIDLKVVDGVGLLWAKRVGKGGLAVGLREGWKILAGGKKEGLIPGVELAEGLIELANQKKWKVMLAGGWENRAKKAADSFKAKYPKLKIRAIEGEPKMSHKETIRHINEYSPDVLLVAMGMRKQEEWVEANMDKLDFGVAIGVGRSFDYWSGELKRAPEWARIMGLEWLYSLYKEPKRWRRQLALIRFVGRVVGKNN